MTMKIAHINPLSKKYEEFVKQFVKKKNLNYEIRVTSNENTKVGEYVVSFAYNLKHCGDTTEDKNPIGIMFHKIMRVLPDKCVEVEIIPTHVYKLGQYNFNLK